MFDRNTTHNHLVCCFCERDLDLDATWCPMCHEYKGIMTTEDFEAYLNTTFWCDCNE
jgi:predicted amidophosphoribosyltransferase